MCSILVHGSAKAQVIPNTADVSRIKPLQFLENIASPIPAIRIPNTVNQQPLTKENAQIPLLLRSVKIEGVTVFSGKELKGVYAPFINKKILLKDVWAIKDKLVSLYKEKGYFLATAYIPAQEIDNGTVLIRVIEGHIASVDVPDSMKENRVVKRLVTKLLEQNPPRLDTLESFLLRLNDINGARVFGSIREVTNPAQEGAIKLILSEKKEGAQGIYSINNYSSRFLGPWRQQFGYQHSFIPLQRTTISASSTIPLKELQFGSIVHQIPLSPQWRLQLSTSFAKAAPGFTLTDQDITSNSLDATVNVSFQPLRQRDENLVFSASISLKDSESKASDSLLSKDSLRLLSLEAAYDVTDATDAINSSQLIITKGLDVWGARGRGDADISRAEASADFTTLQLNLTREQPINERLSVVTKANGLFADTPLFSSQEFSYGGATMGRAFDVGEISGDKGISASLELQYTSLPYKKFSYTPFIFYDRAKVWNNDTDGRNATAASVGAGLRLGHDSGLGIKSTLAQPLLRRIDTPRFGNSGKNPVLLVEFGIRF